MPQLRLLHRGCISSVFCSGETDDEHKIVKAYHKGCDLQPRHWLNISREVAILNTLRDLKTPGVVQLRGTLDDAANLCLVFEPCRGGDLYKRLASCGLLSEAQLCKEVIIPLLKVLSQLHSLGIIHRDVKPENIFFDAAGGLVLGDFGLAIRAPERATSRVGTMDYMAPEVLAQPSPDVVALRQLKPRQLPSYDNKVDVWALGVLVYESLMGVTPFGHPDPEMASLQAQFRRPAPLRPGVSSGCADFVARVLTKQAGLRPSAAQLLGHPWVQQHLEAADVAAHGAAAQQWFGAVQVGSLHSSLAGNIERVASCPDSTPAADTTPAAAAAAAAAGACAQRVTPGIQASVSKIDGDRFVNMSHFLQQSLVQQQQSDLSIASRQRPWERLVQQHRQQQQLVAAPGSPAIAAAALNPFGAAAQACIGRSASAHWAVSAFAGNATAGCGTAQPQAALPQSPICIPGAAPFPPGMPPAAVSPAAVQLATATSLPSALQQSMLCSSTPASPVTDKSGAGFWLLSPQQPAAKHVPGHSWGQQQHQPQQQQQQPAILAGLPLYAAGKLRRPAAAGGAAAAAGAGAAAGNAQGMLQSHFLGSPMQAQIAAWPMAGAPLSPVVNPTPAAAANNASYLQLFSPCKAAPAAAAAAASPARPHVLAPTPTPCLVRHASAGLLLHPSPHCASLPPAPLPYRPGLRVQRELLQGTGGLAAAPPAAPAPAGDRGLHASSSAQQLLLQPVGMKLMARAAGSSSGSSGFGGAGSSSNCSSRSSSPDVPCCSPASPEIDAVLGGSADCCVGLGLLSVSSFGVKQVLPDALGAAADAVEADQQQRMMTGRAPAIAAQGAKGAGARCDADLSRLGELLVASHSSVGLAAAATAAAALPVHTAAAAAQRAKCAAATCDDVGDTGSDAISSRCCSPSVAASAVPLFERQAALEEELARAKKTRARNLWKKVQAVCRMVAKPRPLAA